jgi:transcription elongation factor Elf1
VSIDAKTLARIIEAGGVPFRQNAISFIFTCPRCSKKDKLYLRKRDGQFVCWVCKETENFKGRPEWALIELYPEYTIAELKLRLYGEDLPDQLQDELVVTFEGWGYQELDEDEISADPVPNDVFWPPQFVTFDDGVSFVKGAQYLVSRGINIEHVRTYDIRYDPTEQRVIFPVKVDGKLIGWQARSIRKTEFFDVERAKTVRIPKILTSETLRESGGHWLMFQDRLKGSEHCVLAEGPVSAIKAHLCGGNVASMGKAVTENQLRTILRYGVKRIYLALDTDAADDVRRIVKVLKPELETYLLLPPPGRDDLGDATQEEVYEQFLRAPRVERDTLMVSLKSTFAY